MRLVIVFTLFFVLSVAYGQRVKKINKYSVGVQFDLGYSFPNFSNQQSRWKGTFYPAAGFSATIIRRISARWAGEVGIGATSYYLVNRSPTDRYVLDFISPKALAGLSYNYRDKHNRENFIRLMVGAQLGYRGTLFDQFENFSVLIEGDRLLYPFIKPELGFRRYFRKKMKGSRFKIAYEIGTFFRLNWHELGQATIFEGETSVTLTPRGNIIGLFCKFLLPVGTKQVQQLGEREIRLPPIIYSPRQSW